ncbi:MAG: gamma carbonic anhydrase family protein, partial [Planctomycetes bacterium]|nr:gamma carbonic anhydrase family protein [Planctomycetota bacterium]
MQPVEGGAYVAIDATVLADVTLGEDASIWFGCVVRGDDAPITIGARTNIQDGTVLHVTH